MKYKVIGDFKGCDHMKKKIKDFAKSKKTFGYCKNDCNGNLVGEA